MVFIFFIPLYSIHRKSRGPYETTGDHAAIRGVTTTFLASVGCLPRSRHADVLQPLHASADGPTPGPRLFRGTDKTSCHGWWAFNRLGL